MGENYIVQKKEGTSWINWIVYEGSLVGAKEKLEKARDIMPDEKFRLIKVCSF